MDRESASFQWSSELIEEAWQRHQQGESWRQLAQAFHYPFDRDSFRRRILKRKGRVGSSSPEPPLHQTIQTAREHLHHKVQQEEMRRLTSRRVFIEEIRDALKTALPTLDPPRPFELPSTAFRHQETAILLISDVHVGQHTPGRINGGWHQDLTVTQFQFQKLFDAVAKLWHVHHWGQLVILDLGDDVEGSNMRVSQSRIVDPLVAQQALAYGQLLAEFVQSCATLFQTIRIERIPGNHGRVSAKAGNAGLDELDPINSWDWIAGEATRLMLRPLIEANRLTLINHEGFYGVTHVYDFPLIFEHGSSLRGGSGWAGIPYYGADRMAAAYRDLEGDYRVLAIGHFHRHFVLPTGYQGTLIANGAFPPTTPFVVSSKHQAARPCQILFALHPEQGVTMIRALFLDTPRTPSHEAR